MAYPVNHPINSETIQAYSSSIGTTPIVAYCVAPMRCKILGMTSIISGAITVANSSCAITIAGTAIGGSPHLIIQSGSAAGQVDTTTFSSPQYANEGDAIAITPSGATGANITAMFALAIVPA